jgi:predicted peptidase
MSRVLLTFMVMSLIEGAAAAAPALAPATTPADFEARTFDDGAGHVLPYRLYIPRGVDSTKRVPLVLFLHGAGGRGTDNLHQLTDQAAPLVFVQPETQARWPVFMVAPQCPPDEQWVAMPWGRPSGIGQRPAAPTWPLRAAVALVDKLAAEFPAIDTANLFVTGMSMGGYGTFDAAARHPGKWKAAVPICGGYDETQIAPLVSLPLWAFHAEDDPTVPVARTRDVLAALRTAGGHPLYTEYPASLHYGHSSWIAAYGDPALLPWMFGPHPASEVAAKPAAAPTPAPAPPGRNRGCACGVGDASAAGAPGGAAGVFALLAAFLAFVRRGKAAVRRRI